VPTVTELHLDGIGAGSASQQLVSKTDTEDGCSRLLHRGPDVLDSILHHSWITRTVGDEQPIVLLTSQLREVVIPRHHLDLDTALDEAAQLVELETDIDTDNTHGTT